MLHKAFSDSDLKLVADAVLQACDKLDGLKDGMIDNPDHCKFEPASLQCKTTKSDACLSQAQVRALETTFAGPKDSKGRALYSDWPYDAGIAAGGWRVWTLGTEQMPAINVLIYPLFVNHVALPPGETPLKDAFSFDFDKDPLRINKSANLINADSTRDTNQRRCQDSAHTAVILPRVEWRQPRPNCKLPRQGVQESVSNSLF